MYVLFQYLSDTLEELNLDSDRSHCERSVAEVPDKKIEVINTRNITSRKRGRVANMLHDREDQTFSAHSSQSEMKALRDQIQSLNDTVNILEQRLTVLEATIKK